jgi:hypothetical protein
VARDPEGKQALFGPPPGANGSHPEDLGAPVEADRGREVLFSAAAGRSGPLSVRCAGCGATTRLGWFEVARRRLPLPLWAPWRRHPFLLTCPACERRRWTSIRYRGSFGDAS